MKVKELIENLSEMPEDMEVQFAYTASDYWRTRVSSKIDKVEVTPVCWSEYHRMDKVVEGFTDDEEGGVRDVVAIS